MLYFLSIRFDKAADTIITITAITNISPFNPYKKSRLRDIINLYASDIIPRAAQSTAIISAITNITYIHLFNMAIILPDFFLHILKLKFLNNGFKHTLLFYQFIIQKTIMSLHKKDNPPCPADCLNNTFIQLL